ncbi:MAG TPA: cobalt transporter CbiM [Solirubrobacteraceae bacterium]
MHIPDGYLSPATCATMGAAMVPVWLTAAQRVKRVVKSRYVPLLALAAAYSFMVMMFNVPIPDGTTAHAVGAVLIAVLLGPWAACIAVSVALLIQALFFGDGGVLAYGANAFNMAFVMPFVGYGVYRLTAGRSPLLSTRRAVAAAAGSYVGINAAALCAAVEFGLQPELFHTADGTPLYAPFHLSQTIPAMALAHLTVAGFVDAALTLAIVTYIQRANPALLRINHADLDPAIPRTPRRLGWGWAAAGIATMVLLAPLGLLAPGGAFGEGAPASLDLGKYGLSAIPAGLGRYADWWNHALLGGYGFAGGRHEVLGYVLSALVGIAAISLVVLALAAALGITRTRRGRERAPAGAP